MVYPELLSSKNSTIKMSLNFLRVLKYFLWSPSVCTPVFVSNCDQFYLLYSQSCVGGPLIVNKIKKVVGRPFAVSWENPSEGTRTVVNYYYSGMFPQTSKSKWNSLTLN